MPIIPNILGFGGESSGQRAAGESAQLQAEIARQLFEQTVPLRQAGIAQTTDFLRTGALPPPLAQGLLGAGTASRDALENQFRVARNNLVSLTPLRGGQLNQALADLETARAGQVGGLQAGLEFPVRTNLFSSALGLGTGQAQTALGGLGAAGGLSAQLGGLQAQQQFGQGQALGTLLALGLKPNLGANIGSSLIGRGASGLGRLFGG